MPRITLKETITKEIDIPMDTLYKLIDNYPLGKPPALPGDSQSLTFSE